MGDTHRMRRPVTILVHPSERNPVARKGDVSCHLKPSRFEVASLEPEPLSCLRSNPVGNVIFADRRGTNRGPRKSLCHKSEQATKSLVSTYRQYARSRFQSVCSSPDTCDRVVASDEVTWCVVPSKSPQNKRTQKRIDLTKTRSATGGARKQPWQVAGSSHRDARRLLATSHG
jgi:hypothetical protein